MNSKNIDWFRLARFQPNIVLRELEAHIKKDYELDMDISDWYYNILYKPPSGKNDSSKNKNGFKELLKHGKKISAKILDIAQKYPMIKYYGGGWSTREKRKKLAKEYVESGFDGNLITSKPGFF